MGNIEDNLHSKYLKSWHKAAFQVVLLQEEFLFVVHVLCNDRALEANLGLWDYSGKSWDCGITPCLKLGLQKSCLKLELRDFSPIKIKVFKHRFAH